mmetsp:Transcript_3077/g.4730  ORF Transcript_3077/g.4730 Transcript_3077/m.4730 type:complete len:377 (+) Transcript_3077:155-1285(+)
MRNSWLLNYENRCRLRSSRRRCLREVKVKSRNQNPPQVINDRPIDEQNHSSSREHLNDDDNSAIGSVMSTNSTVVSFIVDKEHKRGQHILQMAEKGNVLHCGAGSVGGHISRQLKRATPESCHIKKDTATSPFNYGASSSELLTFRKAKPVEREEWNQRIYPKSLYFDEIPPRKGTMPKQRYDNTKTTTVRDSVIRDKMYGSIQSPAPSKPHTSDTCEHEENDVIYPSFENESSNNVWDSLFDEFRTAGSAIRPADLVELANIHVTPEYVSPVFEYIHILILGKNPEQKKVYSSKCDARKILLRESSSLLQYMQQIDPRNIPLDNIKEATEFFKGSITPNQGHTLARLSKPFTKVVRWAISMNKLCQMLLHADSIK